KNATWSREQIEANNLNQFQHPTPYAVALAAMLRQHVDYPPRSASASNAALEAVQVAAVREQTPRYVPSALPQRPVVSQPDATISLEQLQQQLKTILATVLRIETSLIDLDKPFVEFGLDSFLGVEMMVAINKKYGTELSNIKLFDYPTVKEFSLL